MTHEPSAMRAPRAEITAVDQIITADDLFAYIDGIEQRISDEDVAVQLSKLDAPEHEQARLSIYQDKTTEAYEAFLAAPRDPYSVFQVAVWLFEVELNGPDREQMPRVPSFGQSHSGRPSQVRRTSTRELYELSAPSWTQEERQQAGTNLYTALSRMINVQNNGNLGGSSKHAAPILKLNGWVSYFGSRLERESSSETQDAISPGGRSQSFLKELVLKIRDNPEGLSPYGEFGLAFLEAHLIGSHESMLREFMGAGGLTDAYFSDSGEAASNLEEFITENRGILLEDVMALPTRKKAESLQRWTINSFCKLLAFVGASGSNNAKAISNELESYRGRAGGGDSATVLPIVAVFKLTEELSKSVAAINKGPLDPTNPTDLNRALERLLYIAHDRGTPAEVYEEVHPRIESIMNIIRIAGETAAAASLAKSGATPR